MDFANRGNRPAPAPQQPVSSPQNESPSQSFQPTNAGKKSKRSMNFTKLTMGLLLVSTTLLVLAVLLGTVFGVGGQNKEADLIQTDKYQAVFLNSQDGQVYFGKLEVFNNDLYQLTDIYYVRVENPIQPEGANQPAQPNISLAKLGNELHGPQDAMYINRAQVLYWENLKDDGQVVTAIKEFQANGGQTQDQTQNQNQQQNNSNTNSNNSNSTEETTEDTEPTNP